ncbi:hypothetical protein, partial [Pseudomonas putida]|uniref:hypothetical protein n=1 Tax=Pseudomonas putida TaxID=303 RepID=UPI001C82977B
HWDWARSNIHFPGLFSIQPSRRNQLKRLQAHLTLYLLNPVTERGQRVDEDYMTGFKSIVASDHSGVKPG